MSSPKRLNWAENKPVIFFPLFDPILFIVIAAIWSENSDFGQNSDQNHGKCSFGQKKVRILDSSQKFWKISQNAGKNTNFFEKIKFWQEKKNYFPLFFTKIFPKILHAFGARNFFLVFFLFNFLTGSLTR